MAVALDTSNAGSVTAAGTSASWSHTITTASNTQLFLLLGFSNLNPTSIAVTVGGVAATLEATVDINTAGDDFRSQIWRYAIASTGSKAVAVSWTGSSRCSYASISFTGVSSSSPVADLEQTGTAVASGNVTVAKTTTSGDAALILYTMTSSTGVPPTIDSGDTTIRGVATGTAIAHYSTYQLASGSSTTVGISATNVNRVQARVSITVAQNSGGASLFGAAALTASGTEAAVGTVAVTGVGALTGSATQATVGTVAVTGVGALAASGTLVAAGTRGALGQAQLAATALLAAAGIRGALGQAQLTGQAALAAAAALTLGGAAALDASGTLTAAGVRILLAQLALAASATVDVAGTATPPVLGAAELTAWATLTAAGVRGALGRAYLTAQAPLEAAPGLLHFSAAAFRAAAVLEAAPSSALAGASAPLAASALLEAAGVLGGFTLSGEVAFVGTGQAATSGVVRYGGQAQLTGIVVCEAAGRLAARGAAALAASASLAATGRVLPAGGPWGNPGSTRVGPDYRLIDPRSGRANARRQ